MIIYRFVISVLIASLLAWSVDELTSHFRIHVYAIMIVHTLSDLARIALDHPDAKPGGLQH